MNEQASPIVFALVPSFIGTVLDASINAIMFFLVAGLFLYLIYRFKIPVAKIATGELQYEAPDKEEKKDKKKNE